VLSTAPITAPSFDKTAGIRAIVAVVDTRLAGVRNHCEGSVPFLLTLVDANVVKLLCQHVVNSRVSFLIVLLILEKTISHILLLGKLLEKRSIYTNQIQFAIVCVGVLQADKLGLTEAASLQYSS
jgi:hypothetical protein